MDNEQLTQFCKEIVKLKQLLTCPICLETIQDNAELHCGHRLCNNCYITLKSNNNTCPVCKRIITRRYNVCKDEIADKLGISVSKICDRIEQVKKSTIEEIVQYNGEVKKTKNHHIRKPNKLAASNQKVPQFTEPSTSKKHGNKQGKDCQNVWINRKGIKAVKHTQRRKDNNDYKVLEFTDSDNKLAVLQWLNDNKNKFNRLTQTQNNVDENEESNEIPIIDLTSVSQVTHNEIKPLHINLTKKPRARSLDREPNNPVKEKSRLSDVVSTENYTIEENKTEDVLKKAEENVLLNIIEDEYLDELENKLHKNKEKENLTTQSSTSGWERLEKMSKTLKKGKTPKTLHVTLQSFLKSNNSAKNFKKEEVQAVKPDFSLKEKIMSETVVNRPSLENDGIEESHDKSLNDIKKDKKVNILSDVVINISNMDPFLLPTQKFNESNEGCQIENNTEIEEIDQLELSQRSEHDGSTFEAIFEKMQNKLKTYLKYIDKNKNLSKRHIESIQGYLEKLNDLHGVLQIKIPTKCIDTSTETEFVMCHAYTQTEKVVYCDTEVQTENIDKNTNSLKTMQTQQNIQNKKKLSKKKQTDEFSASLDIINFETQEIEQQYFLKKSFAKSLVNEKKSQNDKVESIDTKQSSPTNQDVVISGKESNKSLKRNLSDSDSSDVVATKKKCNRFIRDDLSIEFDATEKLKSQKTIIFDTVLSIESDEENDEYLNKILKKYEKENNVPISPNDTDRSMDDYCDKTVASIKENVIKLSKSNEISKSSYRTATTLLDDDNLFLNDLNLSKLDNDVRLHADLKGESESSDIIAETESVEPLPKKMKLKSLNTAFNKDKKSQEDLSPIKPVKTMKGTYCQELEDLDDADFENIEMEEINQNVKINGKIPKSVEEDLFSDEDIVETTPQKVKKNLEKKSQHNVVANLSSRFPMDIYTENAFGNDFDFTPLAPPPGFEDENENDNDVTIINVQQEKDKPVTQNICTTPLNKMVKKLLHSTPCTQFNTQKDTLDLSPIVCEKSYGQSNTIISLDIPETPRKHNILTSNPKQKSILNYVKQSQESNSGSKQKPCIACTRLSKDQIQGISLLTNKKLATYSVKFHDSVTHMIVSVDENKRIKDYTMKFVAAVASGIWVVGYDWVQECLAKNKIVPEEPYEAFDDLGNPGPKMARITKTENKLFKDYCFYCVTPLYSIKIENVEDIINKLGGTLVQNIKSLSSKDGNINLIITEGRSTQDFEIYEKFLEKYKVVTVDIEWLSRCVGRYKILSIRPYIWCSDNMLDDLGYPPHLIENTLSSCSSNQT